MTKVTIDDICSYIVKLLDQEYDVSFVDDTFYCKNYVTYQKLHAEHVTLNLSVLGCEKIVNYTEKPICLPAIRKKLENFLSSHPYSNSGGL